MKEEIQKYVEELIKSKLSKAESKEETKEVNLDGLFKSFTLGSTLEQSPTGNYISNTRKHNAEADLAKAYVASPRNPKKKK